MPIRMSCCIRSVEAPARSVGTLSIERLSRTSAPVRARRSSHIEKSPRTTRPPTIRNGTTEKPNGVISWPAITGVPSGLTQPHSLLLRIPKTASPNPIADNAAPT